MPKRPPSKPDRARAKPLPRGPSMFSLGMRQLTKLTAQVSEARKPIFCSMRSTAKPGVSVGTKKADKPFLPSSGSVTAKTIAKPARLALLINCLLPLSTQCSPSSTALVRRLLDSEPACGSVKQKQASVCPEANCGTHSFLCCSVPQFKMGVQPSEL